MATFTNLPDRYGNVDPRDAYVAAVYDAFDEEIIDQVPSTKDEAIRMHEVLGALHTAKGRRFSARCQTILIEWLADNDLPILDGRPQRRGKVRKPRKVLR